jgi:hypothetical protein
MWSTSKNFEAHVEIITLLVLKDEEEYFYSKEII